MYTLLCILQNNSTKIFSEQFCSNNNDSTYGDNKYYIIGNDQEILEERISILRT